MSQKTTKAEFAVPERRVIRKTVLFICKSPIPLVKITIQSPISVQKTILIEFASIASLYSFTKPLVFLPQYPFVAPATRAVSKNI